MLVTGARLQEQTTPCFVADVQLSHKAWFATGLVLGSRVSNSQKLRLKVASVWLFMVPAAMEREYGK